MSRMRSYDTAVVCPFCQAKHDAASSTKATDISQGRPRAPKDGDLSICIQCGEWCIFENNALAIPDEETYRYIAGNAACQNVREAWLKVRAAMKLAKQGGH